MFKLFQTIWHRFGWVSLGIAFVPHFVGFALAPHRFSPSSTAEIFKEFKTGTGVERSHQQRNPQQSIESRDIQSLIDQLKEEDLTVQGPAAERLGKMGPAAIELLLKALKDPDPVTRRGAADALRWMKDARVVPEIIASMHDSSLSVRIRATEALGQMWPGAPDDEFLRMYAELALSRITGRTVAELLSGAAHSEDPRDVTPA